MKTFALLVSDSLYQLLIPLRLVVTKMVSITEKQVQMGCMCRGEMFVWCVLDEEEMKERRWWHVIVLLKGRREINVICVYVCVRV